ncbi:MAG TPA: hypothetical protein VK563_05995 [Puia sp.]|nr:hypothetical protein [Puia sp.]
MRKAFILFSVLVMLTGIKADAQSMGSSYETAVGVKFWPGALSIKHFTQENRALEGLVNFWDHGFRVTGLYEIHGDINGAPGLKWYVGPGAHIGFYNGNWYHGDYYYRDGGFSLGVDGVLGLDYKFSGAPIAVSLDIQPYIELVNHAYFDVWGGLGVRYTF